MSNGRQALAQAWDRLQAFSGAHLMPYNNNEGEETYADDLALVRAEYDKMRALLDQMTRVGQIGRSE